MSVSASSCSSLSVLNAGSVSSKSDVLAKQWFDIVDLAEKTDRNLAAEDFAKKYYIAETNVENTEAKSESLGRATSHKVEAKLSASSLPTYEEMRRLPSRYKKLRDKYRFVYVKRSESTPTGYTRATTMANLKELIELGYSEYPGALPIHVKRLTERINAIFVKDTPLLSGCLQVIVPKPVLLKFQESLPTTVKSLTERETYTPCVVAPCGYADPRSFICESGYYKKDREEGLKDHAVSRFFEVAGLYLLEKAKLSNLSAEQIQQNQENLKRFKELPKQFEVNEVDFTAVEAFCNDIASTISLDYKGE